MIDKIKSYCKHISHCHDYGLLVLRIAVGYLMVVNHGWDKLLGGPERWADVGEFGMKHLEIHYFYTLWGFLASFSESIGSIFIGIGLGTRFSSLLLMLTMLVAANFHITTGKGNPESALIYAFTSLALVLTGGGKFSVDHLICSRKK